MDLLTFTLIILAICGAIFCICGSIVLVKTVRTVNDLNKIVEENTKQINETMENIKEITDEFNAMTQKVSGAVKGVEKVIHTPLDESSVSSRLNGLRKNLNLAKNILFSTRIVLDILNRNKEKKAKNKSKK